MGIAMKKAGNVAEKYGRDAKLSALPSERKLNVGYKTKEKGLTEALVREISDVKGEPEWMLKKRLDSFAIFKQKPMPNWGPDLSKLDLDALTAFVRPKGKDAEPTSWKDVPPDIRKTFDVLGVPEAERKFLSGASAQYDSEVLYKSLRKNISELGVIFTDMDSAVKEYPELVKRYFMTRCVPAKDNKFSALHGAFWSGGSFVYVPQGVKVPQPLQIYFMMNYPGFGRWSTRSLLRSRARPSSILRAARPRITQKTRCILQWWKYSQEKAVACATHPSRTGARMCTT